MAKIANTRKQVPTTSGFSIKPEHAKWLHISEQATHYLDGNHMCMSAQANWFNKGTRYCALLFREEVGC